MKTFKEFLKEALLVARKRSNGKIQVGKPGYIHADLLSTREMDRHADGKEFDGEMGFVHHENKKKFLTRDQALRHMQKKEPKNLRTTKSMKDDGLHTNNIRDHNKVRSK
jgi:hypothetical protein